MGGNGEQQRQATRITVGRAVIAEHPRLPPSQCTSTDTRCCSCVDQRLQQRCHSSVLEVSDRLRQKESRDGHIHHHGVPM